MKINKKAQMKIQQMSFMIIAVFLFFGLVGMMVLAVKFSGLKQTATELREQNAILLVKKLASSPEFSCGSSFGTEKTDCIDLDKVMALKENIRDYEKFWGVSDIEIRRIYPKDEREVICTLENYPNCNLITLMNNKKGYDVSNFVALCRKEEYKGIVIDKCEIGKLIIRYEEFK